MPAIAQRALRRELGNVEDNLYRFRHFADPTMVTPNGEKISTIIASLEAERDEIKKALHE